jgi:hypothetical protein
MFAVLAPLDKKRGEMVSSMPLWGKTEKAESQPINPIIVIEKRRFLVID